jgi:glycosyltransferase involved in cell wall biosynthesis
VNHTLAATPQTETPAAATREPVDLSVIVPARNAATTLSTQLEALSGQTYDGVWEVVVVDNGSTDATVAVALAWQRKIERLRVISAPWHAGAGHSRNVGARATRGRLVLCCDADDVVADGWISAMVRALKVYDLVGGVVDRSQLNSASALAWRPGTGSDLLDGFTFMPYVSSACLGMRREMWHRVGGFDERFVGGDDVDLCWRVQLAGGRLGAAPDAVVHYRLRPTLTATMRQLYHYGRSHTQLYRQYRDLGMPPSTRTAYTPIDAWRRIRTLVPRAIRSRSAFTTLCADVAFRAGRLTGSINNRVLYL